MEKLYSAGRFLIVLVCTAAVLGCATFKGEIPIGLNLPDTMYISPKNGDGIQDELFISLGIPEIANLVVQG